MVALARNSYQAPVRGGAQSSGLCRDPALGR